MRGLIIVTIAIVQINGQHGGMGSDMGGGMGSGGMSGMGSGMVGFGGIRSYPPSPSPMGNDMGGHGGMGGYGGMGGGMGNGMGSGMGVPWCCPMKKIYGSPNGMDGIYTNVGKLPWNKLPYRCNSPCVYERKNSYNGIQYCFADSFNTQAECDASYDDGEEPVDMGSGGGYGSEDPVDTGSGGMESGSMGSSGMGCGSMGSGGKGSGSGSGSGSSQGSGSGSGSGSGMSPGPCPPIQLMKKCDANCVNVASPPNTLIFKSEEKDGIFETSWTVNKGDPGDTITLKCPNQVVGIPPLTLDATTTCTNTQWTLPEQIQILCTTSQASGSDSGSGSGSGNEGMGMGDHGGSSTGEMEDHGGSSAGGMGDHGSSGDGGMGGHRGN